jgi:hypothetical protein
MTVDNFTADPEAEAGAAYFFGGEKRLEDAGDGAGGHTGTGIRDGEDNTGATGLPVGSVAGAEQEAATGGFGRVDGVPDEIAEHLTNLAFEADDGAVCSLAAMDGNVAVIEATLIKRQSAIEEFAGGDGSGKSRLPVKAEGTAGNDRDALELGFRGGEILLYFLR